MTLTAALFTFRTDTAQPNQLEHLIALRSDVELIIVKLLGIESIDYAHVGLLFDDVQCKSSCCLVSNCVHIHSTLWISATGLANLPFKLPWHALITN